jgi:hypothetical protein
VENLRRWRHRQQEGDTPSCGRVVQLQRVDSQPKRQRSFRPPAFRSSVRADRLENRFRDSGRFVLSDLAECVFCPWANTPSAQISDGGRSQDPTVSRRQLGWHRPDLVGCTNFKCVLDLSRYETVGSPLFTRFAAETAALHHIHAKIATRFFMLPSSISSVIQPVWSGIVLNQHAAWRAAARD